MAYMQWSEALSIGIEELDREHERLVDLLNEAYAVIERGASTEAGLSLLDGMAAYAATHFATEERLMEAFEHPGREVHRRQHEFFLIKVRTKRAALSADAGAPWREDLFRFLSDWLAAHILGEDRLLGDYLRGRGMR
ncbi:bacteriohemerythrin [Pseudodesulfovibrio sp.]|uniref:bacteriohemerythrin n=1 Tax=Pseudodesulfovibrio sp. TaxID=2035812 RepID=UPI00261522D6|nr:bacteriohemerythrin [Pseudodesulfovibrio sp.]MDD3311883.1 bacteriohemerythrin [Pseudodesulfovibrio sp.]